MNKAVFLDRDGVINELIFNEERKEYEPPHEVDQLKLCDGVIEALQMLQESGFKLFLISNQPDYAKGKTSLENLKNVHRTLNEIFLKNKISFTEYYYCYHHPDGIIPEYSVKCDCRKPGTYFTSKAISEYGLDKKHSWLIGDRDKDIQCGINSGLKTIFIKRNSEETKIIADYNSNNLKEAAKIIIERNHN